jgi:hypothetical protein
MSLSLGQTLAGLLNATFGNAVEIIVGIVALFKGEVRIVQTSVCTRPECFSAYTCLPCADARLYFIEYSLGFGLLFPRWFVEISVHRSCALTRGASQVASLNMRASLA